MLWWPRGVTLFWIERLRHGQGLLAIRQCPLILPLGLEQGFQTAQTDGQLWMPLGVLVFGVEGLAQGQGFLVIGDALSYSPCDQSRRPRLLRPEAS